MQNRGYSILFGVAGIILIVITGFQLISYFNFKNSMHSVAVSETSVESGEEASEPGDEASETSEEQSQDKNAMFDLNKATKEQLKTIDGIGDVKAELIIKTREELGGFTSLEQLKGIKGIGDKLFQKIVARVYIK